MPSAQEKRESLSNKTFLLALSLIGIFGVPAIIGFFVGRWVDSTYDMRPYGSMAVLAVTLIFSWILVIRMYLKLTNEYKRIREEEEKERAQIQKNLREEN